MGFSCFICGAVLEDVSKLRAHVLQSHQGALKPPYRCGQGKCLSTFDNIGVWSNHIQRSHRLFLPSPTLVTSLDGVPTANDQQASTENTDQVQHSDHEISDGPSAVASCSYSDSLHHLNAESLHFISCLQSTKTLTTTVLSEVLSGVNRLSSQIGDRVTSVVLEAVGDALDNESKVRLSQQIEKLTKPLQFASSVPKLQSWLKSQPGYVAPVELIYGPPRYERNADGTPRVVYDSWQYVPICETLKMVFGNTSAFNHLVSIVHCKPTGLIRSYTDAIGFKRHPLFSDGTKISVAIELYYDDMETTNPLGSKTIIHKVGLFYFAIKNLPPHLLSSTSNTFLLALCYTDDLKRHSYTSVLNKIAMEIKLLETTGLTLNNGTHIYGSIAVFLGDNLARHTIFGFFESFRANRFCSTCMATQDDLQTKFTHGEFVIRSENSYNKQLKEALSSCQKQSEFGLKRSCPLNQTLWHLTRNNAGDLMHDVLEGVAQFEMKLVLNYFIKTEARFTLDVLNTRIGEFNYGPTDKKNRPSSIPAVSDVDTSHGLKQKAFQAWCLLRLLPVIIGDLVPQEHVIWQFFLQLRRICDLLFAQTWTLITAEIFIDLYKAHLADFKRLFPTHSLIPKHHFLLHYAHFALHSGPPYKNMVARHEIKGNFFKRIAHITCNFKNLLKTLANKHQLAVQSLVMAGRLFNDFIEVLATENTAISALPCPSEIAEYLGMATSSEISIGKKVIIHGYQYDRKSALPIRRDDHLVIFGTFYCLVAKSHEMADTAIVVRVHETLDFDSHMWAYVVEPSDRYELIPCGSFLDMHPLDVYQSLTRDCSFIVARYDLL